MPAYNVKLEVDLYIPDAENPRNADSQALNIMLSTADVEAARVIEITEEDEEEAEND